jgi:predicted Zn-dependent protease
MRNNLFLISGLVLTVWLSACATSPLGRKQLTLFPEADVAQMGITAYQEIKKNTPVDQDSATNNYVDCVANAITSVVTGEYANKKWEVTVFKDKSANAFALPGRKIGVHTGILRVAVNQDQLATVIGHEVAHVLAHHSNERVSTQYAAQTGIDLLRVLAGESTTEKDTLFGLLGIGAQYGIILPFSRTQESEADLLGLDLMATAGFDPRASVDLWKNMAKAGGGQPPEFLSTHPSHQTRIQDLQKRIPKAMKLYGQATKTGRKPQCRNP